MGKAIVINSGKGGVGKSTMCISICAALAKRKYRVLMIDCDAGLRTLDKLTGSDEKLLFDLSDIYRGRCTPSQAITHCKNSSYVIAAPLNAENMPTVSFMKKLIKMLKGHFDFVFLDCAAGLGSEFKITSSCADSALIVCTPDPVSIRASTSTSNALEALGVSERNLIINRFNPKLFDKFDDFEDLDRIIDDVGVKIIGLVPEDIDFAGAVLSSLEPHKKSKANLETDKIAARVSGEYIPIV